VELQLFFLDKKDWKSPTVLIPIIFIGIKNIINFAIFFVNNISQKKYKIWLKNIPHIESYTWDIMVLLSL